MPADSERIAMDWLYFGAARGRGPVEGGPVGFSHSHSLETPQGGRRIVLTVLMQHLSVFGTQKHPRGKLITSALGVSRPTKVSGEPGEEATGNRPTDCESGRRLEGHWP